MSIVVVPKSQLEGNYMYDFLPRLPIRKVLSSIGQNIKVVVTFSSTKHLCFISKWPTAGQIIDVYRIK